MEEITSPNDVQDRFNEIDGIEANHPTDGRVLVKVTDESAVGHFFRVCRQNDFERAQTTREDLNWTVLDSWVSPSDE